MLPRAGNPGPAAVSTSTSAASRAGATRGAGVGGSGKRLLLRNGGQTDRLPAPGTSDGAREPRGSSSGSGGAVPEEKRPCRAVRGKVVRRQGGGERRAGWRSTRRGRSDRGRGAAGGARQSPGPGSARSGQLAPRSPEPSRQRRALTFQLRRRSSSLREPGTSAPKGRRCGTGANWPKCGNRSAARPSLPTRPLPRRGSPTTPVAAAARLYPVPIVPPPRPASTRTQPRSHSDCSEAAAPPPARPPGQSRHPGTSARRRPQAGCAPAPLGGRRGPVLPIGPTLILNKPMGAAVSGRHGDRCC